MTADKCRRLVNRHAVAAVIALPGLAAAQAPGGTLPPSFLVQATQTIE